MEINRKVQENPNVPIRQKLFIKFMNNMERGYSIFASNEEYQKLNELNNMLCLSLNPNVHFNTRRTEDNQYFDMGDPEFKAIPGLVRRALDDHLFNLVTGGEE